MDGLPNKAILSFPVVFFVKYGFYFLYGLHGSLLTDELFQEPLKQRGFFIEVCSLILEIKSAYISLMYFLCYSFDKSDNCFRS